MTNNFKVIEYIYCAVSLILLEGNAMAKKQNTLNRRKKARRVRISKECRRQNKKDFASYLATVEQEEAQALAERTLRERVEQDERDRREALYRKRQLVIEFGPEVAEEIDWGEPALRVYCEESLSQY